METNLIDDKTSKLLKIKVTSNNGKIRFTIPAKELRRLNARTDNYVKVNVKKDEWATNYYVSIPSMPPSRTNLQVKREVPKKFVEKTGLKAGDFIEVSISLIENKRSNELIKDDKLDVLAAIPEKTNKGKTVMVDLFKKNNEEYCRVWYCSGQGGIARLIELKRYIEIDRQLGEFFGLMQAESRKGGHKFDFTNNLLSEHKQFIGVAERFGIHKGLWKYQIFYNPLIPKEKVDEEILTFRKDLGINNNLIFTKNKLLTKIALTVYIDCNILAEIMIALMLRLRARVANSIETEELSEFATGFICKDLLGDGTVVLNTANGNLGISISEQDIMSQNDITKIFCNLGIRTRIFRNRIILCTDMDVYLWLLKNRAFGGHENRAKLLMNILNNLTVKSPYERLCYEGVYTTTDFCKKHDLFINTGRVYLGRATKRGLLRKIAIDVYDLTDYGRQFIEVIKKSQEELSVLADYPLRTPQGSIRTTLSDMPAP